MVRVKIYLLTGLMGLLLTACPPFCHPENLDFGTLPEEALAMVPYVDGESYRFVHSAGKEIIYSARRESTQETEYWDECSKVSYEKNTTDLIPDYPVFSFSLWILKHDSIQWSLSALIGTSNFLLYMNNAYQDGHVYNDSLSIAGVWYKDVYRMRRGGNYYESENGIRPDSLWYNTVAGILKVSMNNGEFYQIVP